MVTIDKVCKEEASSFVMFDPEVVRGLCRRGLVYFDVPIYPDDRLKGVFDVFMVCSMFWLNTFYYFTVEFDDIIPVSLCLKLHI